jgi:DNA-binding response OmpR family regulator
MVSAQAHLVAQVQELLNTELHTIHSPEALVDEYQDALDVCIIDTDQDLDSSLELCKRLREVQPQVGIVCITKASDQPARIKALVNGADHALSLPLEPVELTAAVHSLSRHLRSSDLTRQTKQNDPNSIEVSRQRRSIRGAVSEQALTQSEFVLLQALVRAKGKQLELWQIYDVLGKNENSLQKTALEAQFSRLRKKLKDAGAGNQALRAMRLKGYQLCCPIWIS